MYILGINGSANLVYENKFGISETSQHDAAAALLHDGELLVAFEEERLNRIKHTNKLPVLAIDACLRSGGISAGQVDCFAFSLSEQSLQRSLANQYREANALPPPSRKFIQDFFEDRMQIKMEPDKIEFVEHHFAHAATAFYPSGFEEALILTIDGSGGEYSGSVYDGGKGGLVPLQTFTEHQSLGHFYMRVTHLLGFGPFDEYKVMGLAPYGDPATYRGLFEEFYTLLPEGSYELFAERAWDRLSFLIPAADKSGKFSRVHQDVAASLQEMLEKVVFHVTDHFRRITGRKKLCLAGGVALNCSLNGRLAYSGLFEDVFVYPAASDCGLPVGSALAAYFLRHKQPRREQLKTLYLGSPIGKNDEIGEGLCQWKNLVRFEKVDDIVRKGAELLAADKVIGWVQGRSEFAPRALGNRSILADPRPEKNKERINSIVKKREGFRPFAPSVMAEHASAYFDLPANKIDSPYMMFVFGVREKYRQQLKAVTHVDGTARVQTVSKKENPRYWALIDAFREISGISVILNTSFNNNAEPIVDSVDDAVVCFLTTRLDYLLIGDYLVEKPDLPADRLAELYLSIPPYMNLKRCETFNRAAGLNPGQRFELSNTFNEKVMEVNGSLFELLVKADGRCSLGCLMRSQGIGGGKECEGLLQKITELWEKRLIRLSPVPLT